MVERVVDWLGPALHPWGYILLAVATMLEASAFVGLFVPGEAALLLGGFLCHEGKLSLPLVIVVAFAGAVVGDSIGSEIGRHGGERLRDTRVGRWIGHERWDKARDMLQHHGGRAVFLGRFVGVVRALVPAVAGDAHLEYRRFLLWNVLGAAVWSTGTVLAGYLAGSAYTVVARWLGWGSLVIAAVVVIGFLTVHFVRKRHSAA
jgi:membrane-associated protein